MRPMIAKCLCESIKFKIKGKLRHIKNCHCNQCMKTHGNYAAYTACNENDIIFLNKKNLKWYQSSKIAKRGFCAKCGASIFYKKFDSNKVSVAAGMLSNPTKLKTISNIFTKKKMDYYKLDKKIPKFKRYSD